MRLVTPVDVWRSAWALWAIGLQAQIAAAERLAQAFAASQPHGARRPPVPPAPRATRRRAAGQAGPAHGKPRG